MHWVEYLRVVLILGIVAAGVAYVQRDVIPEHAPPADATVVDVATLGVRAVAEVVLLPMSEGTAAIAAIVLFILLLPSVRAAI